MRFVFILAGLLSCFAPAIAQADTFTYNFRPGETKIVYICCGPNCKCSDAFNGKQGYEVKAVKQCDKSPAPAVSSIISSVRLSAGTLRGGTVKSRQSKVCGYVLKGRIITYTAPKEKGTVRFKIKGQQIVVNIK